MYANRLAVAIKSKNRVLKEFKDTVFLPFGSEYSILIKNLNLIRALVHVNIDGQNMTRDGIVVDANKEVELERILKENLDQGNRFKFIERSDTIEQHRGVKLEDGIIRIEYQFEELVRYRQPILHTYIPSTTVWRNDVIYNSSSMPLVAGGTSTSSVLRSASMTNTSITASSASIASPSMDFVEQGFNDAGITVPGSISNQRFTTVASFPLQAEKHVMILKLLGETPDNEPIRRPVTVKHKPKCQICGKQNKANAKFCSTCGTSLTVLA